MSNKDEIKYINCWHLKIAMSVSTVIVYWRICLLVHVYNNFALTPFADQNTLCVTQDTRDLYKKTIIKVMNHPSFVLYQNELDTAEAVMLTGDSELISMLLYAVLKFTGSLITIEKAIVLCLYQRNEQCFKHLLSLDKNEHIHNMLAHMYLYVIPYCTYDTLKAYLTKVKPGITKILNLLPSIQDDVHVILETIYGEALYTTKPGYIDNEWSFSGDTSHQMYKYTLLCKSNIPISNDILIHADESINFSRLLHRISKLDAIEYIKKVANLAFHEEEIQHLDLLISAFNFEVREIETLMRHCSSFGAFWIIELLLSYYNAWNRGDLKLEVANFLINEAVDEYTYYVCYPYLLFQCACRGWTASIDSLLPKVVMFGSNKTVWSKTCNGCKLQHREAYKYTVTNKATGVHHVYDLKTERIVVDNNPI